MVLGSVRSGSVQWGVVRFDMAVVDRSGFLAHGAVVSGLVGQF